ncbi:hypothetical protein L0Z64_14560 [Phaeobacter sp. BS23]|uniref:hypothetical protein n=1 Tax=Phaeobacter sp. BS23 TaxID=2907239 RepID=UPI003869FC55
MNDMTFDHAQQQTAPTMAAPAAPSPVTPSDSRDQANATKALLAILLYVLLWGLAVAIWGLLSAVPACGRQNSDHVRDPAKHHPRLDLRRRSRRRRQKGQYVACHSDHHQPISEAETKGRFHG